MCAAYIIRTLHNCLHPPFLLAAGKNKQLGDFADTWGCFLVQRKWRGILFSLLFMVKNFLRGDIHLMFLMGFPGQFRWGVSFGEVPGGGWTHSAWRAPCSSHVRPESPRARAQL